MILLDTNVLLEPLKPAPHPAVLEWLDQQVADTLFISTVSLAEMRFGMAVLPEGQRRDRMITAFESRVVAPFRSRMLPFDAAASEVYAVIQAGARKAGKEIAIADGYIAAIAELHGFALATRDTSPFVAAGLHVINPWM